MASFIIAGIPRSSVARLKAALETHAHRLDGWDYLLIPGHLHKDAEIAQSQVDQILEAAASCNGAHILGFSAQRSRELIDPKIRAHFRFRWCDNQAIFLLSSEPEKFIELLVNILTEEFNWRTSVMPQSFSSPLVLPGNIFSTSGEFRNLWRLSESYNSATRIAAASELIESFRSVYRKRLEDVPKTPWVDDSNRIWDDSGPRHGQIPFPKEWKYSHRLPDGFHFDVRHLRRQRFEVPDISTSSSHIVRPNGYVNIDAHGFIR